MYILQGSVLSPTPSAYTCSLIGSDLCVLAPNTKSSLWKSSCIFFYCSFAKSLCATFSLVGVKIQSQQLICHDQGWPWRDTTQFFVRLKTLKSKHAGLLSIFRSGRNYKILLSWAMYPQGYRSPNFIYTNPAILCFRITEH